MIKRFSIILLSLFLTSTVVFSAANDPFPTSFEEFDRMVKKSLVFDPDEDKNKQTQQACPNPNIEQMTVKNLVLPQPLPKANKDVDSANNTPNMLNVIALGVAILALLLALVAMRLTRRADKVVTTVNSVADHWYTEVIHPQCYQPLIALMQGFEKQLLAAKERDIDEQQKVKLLWQLQTQKQAIVSRITMVITPDALAEQVMGELDGIFAQMESDSLAELSAKTADGEIPQVKCVAAGMRQVTILFRRMHEQMVAA